MEKKKTINTFLDFYSMKRLKGLKKLIYKFLWIKIPFLKSEQIITISNKTLKEKIAYLTNNINLVNEISTNGHKRLKKDHTDEIRSLEYLKLINDLI